MADCDIDKLNLHQVAFNPKNLVIEVIQEFREWINRKGLSIRCSFDSVNEEVIADQSRFRQIVQALLADAIAYTQQGVIDVQLESNILTPDYLLFIVEGTLSTINYEPVSKLIAANLISNPEMRLAPVKHLLELLGGQLEINTEQGEEMAFVVTFPVKQPLTRWALPQKRQHLVH